MHAGCGSYEKRPDCCAYALLLQRLVFLVQLAPQVASAKIECCSCSGAAAHERVKHDVTWATTRQDARLDQCWRERGEVVYNDLIASTFFPHFICHRNQFRRRASIADASILRRMNGSLARQNTALGNAVILLKQPALIWRALSAVVSFSARHTWPNGRRSAGRFARSSVMGSGSRRTALVRTILSTILMLTRR